MPLVFPPFCSFAAEDRGLRYSFFPVAAIFVLLCFELEMNCFNGDFFLLIQLFGIENSKNQGSVRVDIDIHRANYYPADKC